MRPGGSGVSPTNDGGRARLARGRHPSAGIPGAMIAALVAAFATEARANPFIEIASAADPEDPFDVNITVDYEFYSKSAAVRRELAGFPGTDPDGPVPLVKDLIFSSTRHEVIPKLEVGIFTDLAVYATLPVIIHDSRRLELDQTAENCVFPGGAGQATCIDRTNSTTIQDGLLPNTGFDAEDPSAGFTGSDPLIFRGVDRWGLDQIHLGLAWAPMNQRRDDTKPTWKIGGEVRVAIGNEMRLDRMDPDAETGVGRGIHEVKLWTSLAKRTRWAIPYFEAWWMATVGETDESQFRDPPQGLFGAERTSPQQHAGTRFGFEAVAWQGENDQQRVGIDASAIFEAHFEGREYSEMWEVFAFAGDARAAGPLVLEADPTAGGPLFSHPGVSNIENYLTAAGRFGIHASLGPRVQFGTHFQYNWHQSHIITFADAGVDLATCSGGQTAGCEIDNNDVVNPGTVEVNPFHVPGLDTVGNRYRVDESRTYQLSVAAMVLF